MQVTYLYLCLYALFLFSKAQQQSTKFNQTAVTLLTTLPHDVTMLEQFISNLIWVGVVNLNGWFGGAHFNLMLFNTTPPPVQSSGIQIKTDINL